MKKQMLLLAAGVTALAITATSCKKDDDKPAPTPPPTKTQLLTAKNWKTISMVVGSVDFYNMMPACEKDDFMSFKSNGTYVSDAGVTKCEPSDPQTDNGTWKFIANETAMVIDATDTFEVKKLTSDTIKVEMKIDEGTGPGQSKALVTFVPKQ